MTTELKTVAWMTEHDAGPLLWPTNQSLNFSKAGIEPIALCRLDDANRRIAELEAQLCEQLPSPLWQLIDSAPKGKKLIVGYPNKLGNWISVMACYYKPKTLYCDDDNNDDGYAREGWYEESESQETIFPTDEPPTHWRPLPLAPDKKNIAQPVQPAEEVCTEAYQVVGSMLSDLGQFNSDRARKVLDNLSACRQLHDDVLPWPSFAQPGTNTLKARIAELEAQLTASQCEVANAAAIWEIAHVERSQAMMRAADLEAQLTAIGAGGVTALVPGRAL